MKRAITTNMNEFEHLKNDLKAIVNNPEKARLLGIKLDNNIRIFNTIENNKLIHTINRENYKQIFNDTFNFTTEIVDKQIYNKLENIFNIVTDNTGNNYDIDIFNKNNERHIKYNYETNVITTYHEIKLKKTIENNIPILGNYKVTQSFINYSRYYFKQYDINIDIGGFIPDTGEINNQCH